MAACDALTTNLSPSCDAIKKPGGLDKRIWIGLVEDLDSVTFGTGNQITAFTFAASTGFITATGKMEKNNSSIAINAGENYNLRTQSFNFVSYYLTAEDLDDIDQLIDQEQLFVCAETNAGTIEVYGINKSDAFDNFGLQCTAIEGGSGTAKLDASQFALTFSGDFENLQLVFEDTAAQTPGLAADIAYLDALVTGT
jgi:hypothetical protein